MENSDIFSTEDVFFLSTPLKVMKQGIDSSICLGFVVIDSEVIGRKFLSPADFSRTQTLYVYKLIKVVVVSENKDLIFATF